MSKSNINSRSNKVLLIQPSKAIRLFLIVLFVFLFVNVAGAQVASSTWALTSNGNSANIGNVSGSTLVIGAGISSPTYSNTSGISTGSWSNDAGSLVSNEYYEFEVTPNPNTIFNVTSINFQPSVSNGNWQVAAYYSTDGFVTSTIIGNVFSLNSATPTANTNTVNINVDGSTLSVRIYGWESDAANRTLRIRNFVISGSTCLKPLAVGTITGAAVVCQGQNTVAYSVPSITNATGYTWTLPSGATIASGANTNAITVNYSSTSTSGNINVQGTNACANGTVSTNYAVTVNPAPIVTAEASLTTVSCGGSVNLTASTPPTTYRATLLSENFNSSMNSWTKTNNSTGGTSSNAVWALRADGYTYTYSGYSPFVFHSNDNSQFYLSNSAAQGNATTATLLQSPSMNTMGYTNLSLEFYQYNLDFDNTDYARVQVSTNGATWTDLALYTTTQGSANSFLKTTLNLNSYINEATLYIRFKYDAQFDWFWAIDNVTVSGDKTINYTYSWTATPAGTAGLPSGAVTASTSNAVVIANPTVSTSYSVMATNPITGCTGTSLVSVTIITPTTPVPGTITQPDCVSATGSIVLGGLPSSGTINQTGTVTNSYPITATTMTISGLVPGTYNFSTSSGICSSSATGNVVINSVVTNTWTTAWSNGTPISSQKLVFTGNYPPAIDPNVDINGCSCKVAGGASVIIKSGRTLTITNEVTIIGGGSLTFENNASLVQINNAAINSGNIIYKRKTASVLNSDYTYWSSPVANQQLMDVSSSYTSGTFYSYDDFAIPEDWKPEATTTVMQIGKGYIIRGPQTISSPAFFDASFVGVPNNGTKTISIGSAGTSNLLGNPYPSAINADLFLAANSTLIEGTIYFWTHKTAIQLAANIVNGTAGSGAYAYTSNDYASYNTTGGVGTGNSINGVEQIANKPTGKIAAGQGFFTTSIASGAVTFDNNMRVSGNNTQFFKTKNPKGKIANTIEKNRIWLNLTNTQGAFKQTLVGYITDATNDYDLSFDGESFDAHEFVDFYSVNQDKNLVIQGRALPFDNTDEVSLGFRTTIDGTFTINIDETDGLLTNQAVFLEDKLTNTIFDLKSGNYTFSTVAGTFNDRFVLKYSNKTLGAENFDSLENKVLVSYVNKQIKINSFAETIDKVVIYDLLGRQIFQKTNVNNNELIIANLMSTHQTLVVKTLLQNGKNFTDKIIY